MTVPEKGHFFAQGIIAGSHPVQPLQVQVTHFLGVIANLLSKHLFIELPLAKQALQLAFRSVLIRFNNLQTDYRRVTVHQLANYFPECMSGGLVQFGGCGTKPGPGKQIPELLLLRLIVHTY